MRQNQVSDLSILATLFIVAIILYIPTGVGFAYASHLPLIKEVRIFQDEYVSGIDVQNFTFTPPVTNQSRSLILISLNHTTNTDQENIMKSWGFKNNSAISFYGRSDIPANNEALKFTATVIEFNEANIQHLNQTIGALEPEGEFIFPLDYSVNVTSSVIEFNGQDHDATDGSWGIEELARIRLLNSTHWGYQVGDTPNSSPTNIRVSVMDTLESAHVQSGEVVLNSTVNHLEFFPPVNYTSDRVHLVCTNYVEGGDFNEHPDDVTVSCGIHDGNPEGNSEIHVDVSNGDSANVHVYWQLIGFNEGLVKAQHGSVSATGGTFTLTDTIPNPILNTSRALAFTGTQTPFGAGNTETSSNQAGGFDRGSFSIYLKGNSTIELSRSDNSGQSEIFWEVLEFFSIGNAFVDNNVTLTDVIPVVDDLNLITDKTAVDSSTLLDQNNNNITKLGSDIIVVLDDPIFDITKQINNTIVVNDIPVGFSFTGEPTTPPPEVGDGGVPSSGAGSVQNPSVGAPEFQRLVGLNIQSEYFYVQPADTIPSDFVIEWFGEEAVGVSLTNIKADPQFTSWLSFSPTPDSLDFETEIDTSKLEIDPIRVKNTALDDFVLNIPTTRCDQLSSTDPLVPCVEPILYEIPVEFEFRKGGLTFHEDHIVQVDARIPAEVQCDIICQIFEYISDNWWWIAGIIFFLMILWMIRKTKKKPLRVVRKVSRKDLSSMNDIRSKKSRKFKKKK